MGGIASSLSRCTHAFQNLVAGAIDQLQMAFYCALLCLGGAFSWLLYQVSKKSLFESYTATSLLFSMFHRKIMHLVTFY